MFDFGYTFDKKLLKNDVGKSKFARSSENIIFLIFFSSTPAGFAGRVVLGVLWPCDIQLAEMLGCDPCISSCVSFVNIHALLSRLANIGILAVNQISFNMLLKLPNVIVDIREMRGMLLRQFVHWVKFIQFVFDVRELCLGASDDVQNVVPKCAF